MPALSWCPSDLTEEAGAVSLQQDAEGSGASEVPGRPRGTRARWLRTLSHLPWWNGEAWISQRREGFNPCATSDPDPGEHSGPWGEFEGFRESSAKSEQFCQPSELPERERPTAPQPPRIAAAQERGAHPPHQGGPWVTGAPVISPSEVFLKH